MLLGASNLFQFPLLATLITALLISSFLLRKKAISRPLLFLSILLLSTARFSISTLPRPSDINQLHFTRPARHVRLIGTVASDPKTHPFNDSQSFSFQCEALQQENTWLKKQGTIYVRYYNPAPLKYGDRLLIHGSIRPQNFPSRQHLKLRVSKNGLIPLSTNKSTPNTLIQTLRKKGAHTLSKGLESHPTQRSIYQALLLGYRGNIPKDTYQTFIRTGSVHIFAISGLHVGIIALFIIILIKSIGVPLDKWSLFLLPLLFLYVYATGMKSSALRAWTMAAVYFIAPLFRRKPDVPNAIAVAAMLILWIKPSEILSAGFIYSFVIVAFLVMVFTTIPRTLIAGESTGWRRTARTYLLTLIICSTTAFLAALPLTALFFGRIAPVALLANLLVVPLTFFIVLSGWLSLLLPFAAAIFNHAALLFIDLLLLSVKNLADLPGAQQSTGAPPLIAILLWYGSWIAFLTYSKTTRQRRIALSFVLVAILWAVLL